MNSKQSLYAPGKDVTEATAILLGHLADRKKLDEKIDAMPGAIATITATIEQHTKELTEAMGEHALADEGTAQHKALAKQVKDLTESLATEEQRLRTANLRVQGLEGQAAKVDEQIQPAINELQVAVSAYFSGAKAAVSAALEEAVKPLRGVLAIAEALGEPLRDTLRGAMVPNPHSYRLLQPLRQGVTHIGENLLDTAPTEQDAAAAQEVRSLIAPAIAALANGRAHRAYVPLAKRPKPYVLRGYSYEGVKGDARSFGDKPDAEPAPNTPQETGPKPLKPSASRARTGFADELPPGTPRDGNVGPSLVNQLMRTDGGSEFAVGA